MKSKYIYQYFLTTLIMVLAWSCSLNREPVSEFSELTVNSDKKKDSLKYTTRAAMLSQYQALYQRLKDQQEHWYLDLMLIAEAHSDNAYGGSTGSEVVPMENNSIDGGNSVLARDWNKYLADVAQANTVICNIDAVPDPLLTPAERKQWKAEAKIFRAMVWFDMIRIWGNIPIVTQEGKDITADNIKEVYPLYYPEQTPTQDAYKQIAQDLTEAITDAPVNNPANKTILSKSVAKALLAKVYAEKPIRDYNKVLQYSNEVVADGFALVADYTDLFGMNSAGTDAKARSTSESILEINYYTGGGNWVTWMFGKDLINPENMFSWAKWVTPSRDLITDFLTEKDNVRYAESIVYYNCTWNNYYPAANYPFMYKIRSSVSSIIKIRLADILLMKAEALANLDKISEAAAVVNQIRKRVKLPELAATASVSKESMLNAVLHERRLELAFEGQRWFDLVRYGKVQEVMNSVNSRDSGRLSQRRPFTETSYLMPIPSTALDLNTNLKQNPGY